MNVQMILGDKGTEVATIAADATVADAVKILGERRIGALPVVEGDRVAGIMSERDVIYCLRDHGAEVLDWPISRVMSAPAITVDPSTPVLNALALITQRRVRHLPVVADGRLVGNRLDRRSREAPHRADRGMKPRQCASTFRAPDARFVVF